MCCHISLLCSRCDYECQFLIWGPNLHNVTFTSQVDPFCVHFNPAIVFRQLSRAFSDPDPDIVNTLASPCSDQNHFGCTFEVIMF
jgi:hypothetical protein